MKARDQLNRGKRKITQARRSQYSPKTSNCKDEAADLLDKTEAHQLCTKAQDQAYET